MPDPGLTPYGLAAQELIVSAWDGAARARVFDLVRREAPQTVIALADLMRPRPRGRRCGCVV